MDTNDLPRVRVQKLIADSFKRAFKDILAAKDTDPKSRTFGQDLRQFFFDGGRGCVSGDTLIDTPSGKVKVKDFKGGEVYSYDGNKIVIANAERAIRYTEEDLYRVETIDGDSILVTDEHRFLRTDNEWVMTKDLDEWDEVFIYHNGILSKSKIASIEFEKRDYYYDFNVIGTHNYVAEGFVNHNSTKSSFISMMIILLMTMNPNSNAVVLVRVADNIRQSVYNQITWAIGKLKLDKYFKCTTSPFLCEYRADPDDPNCPVQQIVFRGLDKAGKLKGIKPKHGVFDIIWFEELTEFAGMEDIRSVMQSVLRGGTDEDEDEEEEEGQGEEQGEGEEEEVKTRAFFSYNPPPSMNNWVNEEAAVEEPGRKCYHSNYLTVNPKWLRKGFIQEAENLRRRNPRAYAHEYLGLITGTGGNVFRNLEIRDITDEEINTKFNNRCFGIDWGFTTDPFVWLGMHFDTDRQWLYIFAEIYKHGLRTQQSCAIVRKYMEEMASPRAVIYADAAEPDSIADFNAWGVKVEAAPKPHGATWSGRDYEIKALSDLNKIIIDPHYCPNTAREFSHYEYQKNAQGKFMEQFPKANDHSIDACRYGLFFQLRSVGLLRC